LHFQIRRRWREDQECWAGETSGARLLKRTQGAFLKLVVGQARL